MGILLTTVIVLLSYLLQTTFAFRIAIFDVAPNLLLCVLVCYTVCRSKEKGLFLGFIIGMLLDLLWGRSFGLYTIAYLCIGALCGLAFDNFLSHNVFTCALASFALTILYGFGTQLLMFLTHTSFSFSYSFLRIILPEAVYNGLLTLPLYIVINNLYAKFVTD